MLDIQKTFELIRNGLFEPRATWQSCLAEDRGWRDTTMVLTLPLILASYVLAGLLSLIFGGRGSLAAGPGIGSWVLSLILAVAGIAVTAFIFSYLAGVFRGRHDFDRGLAAVSLAAIPGCVGNIVAVVPFIGWLVSLVLGIVSLVFLYRIIPVFLQVPEDKRVLHFVASLVSTMVAMLILSAVLGAGFIGAPPDQLSTSQSQPGQPGMFGQIERHARLMEQAEQQRYEPPADGRITEAQMQGYMTVMRKTAEIREERRAEMQRLGEKYQDREPGAADLVELSGGIGSAIGAFNAEMEVVMTGGDNWAEHQWIKEQLRTARIHKDLNEAVRHNYELYQAHRAELDELSAVH